MAYEVRPNTGSLFRNDKKETDTHPNAKGSALIDGVEYWVDAWTNEARDGSKYQSLKFKPKEARTGGSDGGNGGGQASRPQPAAFDSDLDDDIPFATADIRFEGRVG